MVGPQKGMMVQNMLSVSAYAWVCVNTLHDSQGFEPSATTSIRSELRLMSRWSRWATRAQCMSLDFTHATLAGRPETDQVGVRDIKSMP